MSDPISPSSSSDRPQEIQQQQQESFKNQPPGVKADAAYTASFQQALAEIVGPLIATKE